MPKMKPQPLKPFPISNSDLSISRTSGSTPAREAKIRQEAQITEEAEEKANLEKRNVSKEDNND